MHASTKDALGGAGTPTEGQNSHLCKEGSSLPTLAHPVDSATRTCCGSVGGHTPSCPVACPSWCTEADEHATDTLRADRNCWGADRAVILHLEEGAPSPHLSAQQQLAMDPPRISPYAYRRWHALPIVYMHIYRPHDCGHLDLDTNVKVTVAEARELAAALIAVADEIEAA